MNLRRIVTGILVGSALALFIFFAIRATLESQIRKAIIADCIDCEVDWQNFSISPSKIGFKKIIFSFGNPAITAVRGRVESVVVHYRLRPLLDRVMEFSLIEVDQPQVVVLEGDEKSPKAIDDSAGESTWRFISRKIEVNNGKFTYSRNYRDRTASLDVQEINAVVGLVESGNESLWTEGVATGVLENSGIFQLLVKTPIFSPQALLDVQLRIRAQKLAALNNFFKPSEGLVLLGTLREGSARATVNEKLQNAIVSANYQDLDFRFLKTRNRGAVAAFISNLAKSLKLEKSSGPSKQKYRAVQITRGEESMISFLLRGMRDAALRVATEK